MSKGFITGTNEELIKAYKESRDESYLKELIEANKGLINLLVSPYLTSIPNSELEDLTSESYIPMLRAIEDYDPEQGVAFSTLLKVYVRQHLNRLYNEATRQKRFTGTTPDSLDRLSEINKESGTETDSTFEVECKDFSSVEFMDLLDSLQLNDKEQVAVNILMAGGANECWRERVMERIWELDIPLQTISDKTGISRSTIYAFLYNGTDLSSMRLAKICSLLGLSMDYVMGLKEKPDGKM